MKYIKLYEGFEKNKSLDDFKELTRTFKILKCDKIKIKNGYKIEWEGFHVSTIIESDGKVYLYSENDKKEYELTSKGVTSLLTDLIKTLSEIKNEKGLVGKKIEIIKDLESINIPNDEIYSELGQNDISTVINFIERGEPSEYYLRKVKKLINKYQ